MNGLCRILTRLVIGYLPNGACLSAYGRESSDLPGEILQNYLDKVAAGTLKFATPRVYNFMEDEVRLAHDDTENNRVVGKLVVKVG